MHSGGHGQLPAGAIRVTVPNKQRWTVWASGCDTLRRTSHCHAEFQPAMSLLPESNHEDPGRAILLETKGLYPLRMGVSGSRKAE